MESLVDVIALALLLLGPVAGFAVRARMGDAARGQLVVAATLGGGLAGLLVCGALALRAPALADVVALWPWALGYGVAGAVLGVAGVLARAFGGWLARRP